MALQRQSAPARLGPGLRLGALSLALAVVGHALAGGTLDPQAVLLAAAVAVPLGVPLARPRLPLALLAAGVVGTQAVAHVLLSVPPAGHAAHTGHAHTSSATSAHLLLHSLAAALAVLLARRSDTVLAHLRTLLQRLAPPRPAALTATARWRRPLVLTVDHGLSSVPTSLARAVSRRGPPAPLAA